MITIVVLTTSITLFAQSQNCKQLYIQEFEEKIKTTQNAVLIDLRTPKEFKSGHIKGAKNLDFFAKGFYDQLLKYPKDTPLFIYCESGGRSGQVFERLKSEGYQTVYEMHEGMSGWRDSKRPVEK
ncbi:MAG: rhodanese-like domain-containing protein [Bacteroidia bacterium]